MTCQEPSFFGTTPIGVLCMVGRGREKGLAVWPLPIFFKSFCNCLRLKEGRFQILDNLVVAETLVANVTAKLKIVEQIYSKLSVRVVFQSKS